MAGFSKHSGPFGQPPRSGNFTSPPPPAQSPPPPFPHSSPARSPRAPLATVGVRSTPLVYGSLIYENSDLSSPAYQPTSAPRRPETQQRVRLPSFPAASSIANVGARRPAVSSRQWVNGQRSSFENDDQTNQRPSAVTSFVASRNSGTSVTAKVSRFPDLKRNRSPTSQSMDGEMPRNFSRTSFQSHSEDNGNHYGLVRSRSPTVPYQNDNFIEQFHPPHHKGQLPALSQPAWDNEYKFPDTNPNQLTHQDQFSIIPKIDSSSSARNFMNEVVDAPELKQTRPLSIPPPNEVLHKNSHALQNAPVRPSTSPPRSSLRSNARFTPFISQNPQRTSLSANGTAVEGDPTRSTTYNVAKRNRSPSLPAADKVLQDNSNSAQDDTEREIEAKAKRLARFKRELTESFDDRPHITEKKASTSRREQSIVERQKISASHSMELDGYFTNSSIPSDSDVLETSSMIIGLCPDMCPVSEREERERKGDLDRYERLDGDRNQTNKFLAVKKYNRTAEREANLIRPMPVLQKTIDYLLSLLDQPYDDRFLGMYNFLWDRMRAIRMDLRMQHIFNQEAITMLEQMIRLHIIAMHELCEYTKGEGFSEGFDAHLNIEQMNKTSVDLFQMYDDHRKKGISIPTEKEFRGYYALLKLDKHPGYKVEPGELSLDLAKMTPEIRQTSEVLFARDVARACRTGNFVAFFRLARKASYLQACLMHAHFSKLRTQALASLHSGLPNNQGIPVLLVANWLAMEEEDIVSLLEYYGFSVKDFEEPYMVKEGPFANANQDYPTKLSKLVHMKKSRNIVNDVISLPEVATLPTQPSQMIQMPKIYKPVKNSVQSSFVNGNNTAPEVDEKMPDIEVASSPKPVPKLQPKFEKSKFGKQIQEQKPVEGPTHIPFWSFSSVPTPPVSQPITLKDVEKPHDVGFSASAEKKTLSGMEDAPLQIGSRTTSLPLLQKSPSAKYGFTAETKIPEIVVHDYSKDEYPPEINLEQETDEVVENYEDKEVAQAKLKLIIRLWKRRVSKKRALREQRQLAANAALSSLSLGPPIRQVKDPLSAVHEFDIEHAMKERFEKREQSWSKLNVSEVTAKILGERNPGARCLCWKIVMCSQMSYQGDEVGAKNKIINESVGPWLLSKLMPSRSDADDDLLISSSGLSIWKNWVTCADGDQTCCLSVVRDTNFDDLNQTSDGAGAILFLVSESIPWKVQKAHFQKLLMSIPSGSSLPLLVLCGSYDKEVSDPYDTIICELGLRDIDKSRVSSFSIVFLVEDQNQERQCFDGFLSDARLRGGLQWLASESPLQPDIHHISTRDLILTYLNSSLDVLEKMSDRDVGPNHCISVFNEALDWSLGEIAAAAESNPINWPCPEIALLPDSYHEYAAAKWYLPSFGWNSAASIGTISSIVRESKLPPFSEAISCLNGGANSGDEIEDLRSQLENCLIEYLTESSGMMPINLAIKEAYIMLQRSCGLELNDSSYHLVPKWISIFRRIFNWRLTRLSKGALSSAYVLRQHHVDPTERIPWEFGLEAKVPLPYITRPSLDEIIVGCSTSFLPRSAESPVEAFSPRTVPNGDVQRYDNTNDLMENERICSQIAEKSKNGGTRVADPSTEVAVGASKRTKETDKLSMLLEQCNILQNSIDEKLFLYF